MKTHPSMAIRTGKQMVIQKFAKTNTREVLY